MMSMAISYFGMRRMVEQTFMRTRLRSSLVAFVMALVPGIVAAEAGGIDVAQTKQYFGET
jgi:hypothetical protein